MHSTSIRNIAISLAMFAFFALGATPVKADQVTVIGNTHPNLAANINITSLTATTITFTVTNLSGAPFTQADIRGIGFALPGTIVITGYTFSGPAGSNFHDLNFCNGAACGTVPQFAGVNLDFAVVTGAGGFTGIANPPGLLIGQSGTFTVTGNFSGLTPADFLNNVYVRFQGVEPGDLSDVAHNTAIPEPATMLLLGSGLIGIAAKFRNRRKP